MSYELIWFAPDEVLHLKIQGTLTPNEMRHISQRITALLDKTENRLQLLIDMSEMAAGYTTAQELRKTQTYMDHPQLETILVITTSKLNRLIVVMAFNLARARFVLMDGMENVRRYMAQRGVSEAAIAINN